MRRRTLVATAATALATPLLAGCARDDGGDGGDSVDDGDDEEDRGAGGMYGLVGTGGTLAADGSGSRSGSPQHGEPPLGPGP